jgi:hypothetical protein
MPMVWNVMKAMVVIFVIIFMVLVYVLASHGGMSKIEFFIVIFYTIIILLLFLHILEGMPTYLRVGERYKMQYYFALPNDQGYILSLIKIGGVSLKDDVGKTYFVKKIVISDFLNRRQIIPPKFLVMRREGDIFFIKTIR